MTLNGNNTSLEIEYQIINGQDMELEYNSSYISDITTSPVTQATASFEPDFNVITTVE